MNKPTKHIRTLENRMAYLESKLTPTTHYWAAEHAALKFAIPLLCAQTGVNQVVFPMTAPPAAMRRVADRYAEEV